MAKKSSWPELLRTARGAASLDATAQAVGMSKSYLWEVERGEGDPSFRKVARLARHYGLDLNQLAECLGD